MAAAACAKPVAPLPERLVLRAARGETLGVPIDAPDASLTLPAEAARVDGFAVHTLTVREPSTRMYGPSRGRGEIADPLEPRAGRLGPRAWFDVAIARDARPGRYAGTLTAGGKSVPVELTVEPVTLDLAKDPLVWVFYLPKEVARVHGVADDDGPAELAWERKYHALFRAHGCFLASDLPPARFEARREFLAGLRYWPVALDLASDETITADTKKWLAIFAGLPQIPFAIPVDEPRDDAARARTRHIGEVMGRAGAGRPKLLRAVTADPTPALAGAIDQFISPRAQRWTYNGRPPQAGSLILDGEPGALRTWGWIAWRYDVELWYAWEGLYFSDRYNRGGPTEVLTNPVTFDERRKGGEDFGNGDGVLAYPGPWPSVRLKILRRGLQDRLLLERLAGCGGRDEAQAIARRMIPRALGEASGDGRGAWPADEAAWERARGELLSAIVKRCPDAP